MSTELKNILFVNSDTVAFGNRQLEKVAPKEGIAPYLSLFGVSAVIVTGKLDDRHFVNTVKSASEHRIPLVCGIKGLKPEQKRILMNASARSHIALVPCADEPFLKLYADLLKNYKQVQQPNTEINVDCIYNPELPKVPDSVSLLTNALREIDPSVKINPNIYREDAGQKNGEHWVAVRSSAFSILRADLSEKAHQHGLLKIAAYVRKQAEQRPTGFYTTRTLALGLHR